MKLREKLEGLNACGEAIRWLGQRDAKTAWNECERGDWMLWIAKSKNIDLRTLTKAKVECAKLVKHLMKDERSLKALGVAEDFANGDATREELDAAYADAYAAYVDADVAYAANAAYAAADAARKETLKKCAEICREHIPFNILRIEGS